MSLAQNPLISKAYGVIRTLSLDEEARMLAESREKALRDAWDREEGAFKAGFAEGEAKGEARQNIKIARAMLAAGKPRAEIIQFTELTDTELDKLQ